MKEDDFSWRGVLKGLLITFNVYFWVSLSFYVVNYQYQHINFLVGTTTTLTNFCLNIGCCQNHVTDKCFGSFASHGSLTWLSGPAILGLGIWMKISLQEVEPLVEHAQYALPVWLLIGAGAAVIVFGILGCIAIFNEKRSLLGFYFVCLLAVFAAEFGSCLQYFLKYEQIESQTEYNLNVSMHYKYLSDIETRDAIDSIQQQFSCCGINNWTDWRSIYHNINHIGPVGPGYHIPLPKSCCTHGGNICNETVTGSYKQNAVFMQAAHVHYLPGVSITSWRSYQKDRPDCGLVKLRHKCHTVGRWHPGLLSTSSYRLTKNTGFTKWCQDENAGDEVQVRNGTL